MGAIILMRPCSIDGRTGDEIGLEGLNGDNGATAAAQFGATYQFDNIAMSGLRRGTKAS